MENRYSILLMDADNTLLDFNKCMDESLAECLTERGIEPTRERILAYERINDRYWKMLERREISRPEVLVGRYKTFFEYLGVDLDPVQMQKDYNEHLCKKAYLMDGALETVRKLSESYDIYIVTNGNAYNQHSRLDHNPIRPYLKEVFISEEMGADKPSRSFFEQVEARIKALNGSFDPEKALVVGDSITSDIKGGQEMGYDTCHVGDREPALDLGIVPTYHISCISDLVPLLDKVRSFYGPLEAVLEDASIKYEKGTRLSSLCTFRIGGEADLLIRPRNEDEIVKAASACRKWNVPYWILGNGSNTLFSDAGLRGAVILTKDANEIRVGQNEISASCGAMLPVLCARARQAGLTGLNFASGIPGTVGGAVFMNSGCYGDCIGNCVKTIRCFDTRTGAVFETGREDAAFGIRDSIFQKKPEWVILGATFELTKGDARALEEEAEALKEKRASSQPLDLPSAGSVFKRTEGQEPVARLIDLSGLKGRRVGDAAVSGKHAGFIVNCGHASSRDVLELIRIVRDEIENRYGFVPEIEIRVAGE